MMRWRHLMIAYAVFLVACGHRPPVATSPKTEPRIVSRPNVSILPRGQRIAVQFNSEPPIIHVTDGRGGPPMLYHGQELNPDRLKSIIVLRTKEARERFGDPTLDAAILIEFK